MPATAPADGGVARYATSIHYHLTRSSLPADVVIDHTVLAWVDTIVGMSWLDDEEKVARIRNVLTAAGQVRAGSL